MSLELQSIGPLWMELGTGLITLLVLAISIYATRFQPLRLRVIAGLLRLLLVGSGFFLLHHPTIVRKTIQPKEQRMAVLVDRTGSMGADSDQGKTRYEKAYELVEELAQDNKSFDVFEFDQKLSQPMDATTRAKKLSGNKTDFYTTLTQLFGENEDYTSVLVLSDGHDLGRFSQMSGEETGRWLERLNAPPINSVLIGDQLTGPEVAIHSIDAPPFSFVRAPLRIRATIIVRNLDNYNTQVQLLDGESVIQIKDLILDDQGFGTVEFEHYPEEEGERLYTIHVPPHHLESNTENNSQQVLIEIGRDKINVLHIAGSITWDLQGLRAMFERNPMIDLTAFYIMRTRDHQQQGVDNRLVPPEEMALVPFPTEEIFDRQLFSFDVVVFHDFDAGTYFTDSYQARRLMKKIREFVTEHRGGFIVIGGPRTASGPSLGLTPLADIIPLVPPAQRMSYDENSIQPMFTRAGRMFPIFRNFDPSHQTFNGSMQSLNVNENAQVLLEGKGGKPLMAVAESGNGRTIFLNTSSSWIWRRDALASGQTAEGYYDFWDQTLKWAIQDPSLHQVRISAAKTIANPLMVNVDLLMRNRDYEPAAALASRVQLLALDGKSEPREASFSTDSQGAAQVGFNVDRPGYYRIQLPDQPWKDLSQPATVFLGGSQDELRNLDLSPETLQRLSSYSGGHFSPEVSRFSPQSMVRGEVKNQTIVETRRLKLRNWIWSLPLLLLIAGVEWALRRSNHLA